MKTTVAVKLRMKERDSIPTKNSGAGMSTRENVALKRSGQDSLGGAPGPQSTGRSRTINGPANCRVVQSFVMQEINTLNQRVRSLESGKFRIGEPIDLWKKSYRNVKAEHAKLRIERELKRKMEPQQRNKRKRRSKKRRTQMAIMIMAEAVSGVNSSLLFATASMSLHQNLSDHTHHFISEMCPASFVSIFSDIQWSPTKETTEKDFIRDWRGRVEQLDMEEWERNSADCDLPLEDAWRWSEERLAVRRVSDNVTRTTAMLVPKQMGTSKKSNFITASAETLRNYVR